VVLNRLTEILKAFSPLPVILYFWSLLLGLSGRVISIKSDLSNGSTWRLNARKSFFLPITSKICLRESCFAFNAFSTASIVSESCSSKCLSICLSMCLSLCISWRFTCAWASRYQSDYSGNGSSCDAKKRTNRKTRRRQKHQVPQETMICAVLFVTFRTISQHIFAKQLAIHDHICQS